MSTDKVYKGYSRKELDEAFSRAHPPDDWKGQIVVRCAGEAVNLMVAAIEFFTATSPRVTYVAIGGVMPFVIESEGYRLGLAGDH